VDRLDLGAAPSLLLDVAEHDELAHADDLAIQDSDQDGVARRGRDLVQRVDITLRAGRVLFRAERTAGQ
jgi:hypothetical protein